jgi:hypothetical protein
MDHIFNLDRFNQNTDFSTFPTIGTSDIDGLIHAKGKCWLFLEAKVEGVGLPRGQEIAAKELIEDLGRTKPAFFAVAHHDTRASEDITGDNLLVSKVYASAPWTKGKVFEHVYLERPTWTNFASDALLVTAGASTLKRILKPNPTFLEGGEQGDILDKLDGYLWRAVENEQLMQEYAGLDCVDREDMSEDLWAFVNSFGFTEEPGNGHNIVQLFEALVYNNWLANRHLI